MKWLYIILVIFNVPLCFSDDAASEPGGVPSTVPQTSEAGSPLAAPAGEIAEGGLGGQIETFENAEAVAVADAKLSTLQRFGIAAGVVVIQGLLIWAAWILFRWLNKRIREYGEKNFKPITIKKFHLLSKAQMLDFCSSLLRILKYAITALQFFLMIVVVFSLFRLTENLASTLFGYILTPLKSIALNIIGYVPNFITIAIILFIMRYVLRTLKYLALSIEKGKVKLAGFYPEWAQPTFNILRVLLYAFTVAVVYPYLPGSDSEIFQGVSVFVGIIFSLGSSSAIGNIVAGLVITYMRPFKIGDRIKLGDITGVVVEKSPIVIRLRTHKNEYVTFPNIMVLNSTTINYNTSQEYDEEGLLLHAEVTMGYAVPWTTMHEILIAAALKTSHTEKTPKPFVLQTALDDNYARYEINVYTKDIDIVPAIYSELYQNLQDGFREANIDLTAPSYSTVTVKKDAPNNIKQVNRRSRRHIEE